MTIVSPYQFYIFNQETALVGAFSVIGKPSGTFR